jgi:hypothetical protein
LACSSSANCWAAGGYGTMSTTTETSLNQILRWNGSKWSPVADVPDPDGSSSGDVNDLSWDTCLSAHDCWAVGVYGSYPGIVRNEALHWNGAKWSVVTTPDPSSTAHKGINILVGARCVSPPNCWAVGLRDKRGVILDEILHWNGEKWSSADNTIS